jgi:hypothetical protein
LTATATATKSPAPCAAKERDPLQSRATPQTVAVADHVNSVNVNVGAWDPHGREHEHKR